MSPLPYAVEREFDGECVQSTAFGA
jgi:hypothetical protein